MCKLYLYEGGAPHGKNAYQLIEMAAAMYMAEASFDVLEGRDSSATDEPTEFLHKEFLHEDRSFEIAVTEKGKPYFVNLPLEFSVTNSGKLWMCAISENPCGLDLQVAKEGIPYEKLAKRFYKPIEYQYVKKFGEAAFFKVWTRREAYGKMIGEGFWGDIPALVNDDLTLVDKVGEYNLSEIEVGDGVYCSLCTSDDEPYEIVLL